MKPLKPGTRVRVLRRNGETINGWIAGPPIPHLLPIGEFYMVQAHGWEPEPPYRGRGRKSPERIAWEQTQVMVGLYARDRMKILQRGVTHDGPG